MKIAFIIDNLGPYHVARLNAVAQVAEVFAIEVRSASVEYPWETSVPARFSKQTMLDASSVSDPRPKIWQTLDLCRPDVLFVTGWSAPADLTGLLWAGRRCVPVIVMSDSKLDDAPRRKFSEWVKRRMLAHVSGAFVAGDIHARYVQKLGIPKDMIVHGYDVVENSHFSVYREGRKNSFLASARFLPRKNLAFLLRVYAAYRRAHARYGTPWQLTLLGDGPLRPELQSLAAELGVDNEVLMPGFVQYRALPEYYARAGAFLHVSLIDQWGLVVNEAMAAGLPVLVSSRCGCVEDLVSESLNGYALDPMDEAAWVTRMLEIATAPDERRTAMADASLKIIARFTPRTHAQAALKLASAVISRPCPRLRRTDAFVISAVAQSRIHVLSPRHSSA